MIDLVELQEKFQSFLLGREADGRPGMEPLTVGSEDLPAGRRLAVYADAYRLRLLEVLADDYPGLKGMVGDEAFEVLGSAYIAAHPSSHPSVRWFGRHMTRFLGEAPGYRERPALAEMAAFEWTQGEVMDAADSNLADVETLAALAPESWPGMRIGFQNALRRLDLAWNVPAVWKAVIGQSAPPRLEDSRTPLPWLFWRRGLEVHWRSLDDDERFAIDAAREGSGFGAICEGLLERTGDGEVPLRAAGFLKGWLNDGLVARIAA